MVYSVGYAGGFVCEQILASSALSIFKAAVVLPAVTSIGSRVATLMSGVKAGQKMLVAVEVGKETWAKVQSTRNLVTRSATQYVKEKTGLDRLEGMIKALLPSIECDSPL